MLSRPLIVLTLVAAFAAALRGQTNEAVRTETWPDGTLKARYSVDEQGNRHGPAEEFAENGTRLRFTVWAHGQLDGLCKEWNESGKLLRGCSYRKGVLHGHSEETRADGGISIGEFRDGARHGKWLDVDASGDRRRTAEYRDGKLHGPLRIQLKDKLLTRQTWRDGELVQLDDLQPFPVPRDKLLAELRGILELPPLVDGKDPLIAERSAALRRLQAYRHLCGLPWQQMTLVPEWNQRCDAGAEICRRIGHLDHHPPRPEGMDEARYRLGYEGTSHSNLSAGSTLERSVDGYMDDSDPSNIERIGHRRWCLNPAMLKTGFGVDQYFSAMWSMDESGRGSKGMAAVCYPPPGFVPVDLFSPGRAFSIALLRGGTPKKDELRVQVQALDGDYLPAGAALQLDWCSIAEGGYGSGPCLVFRPVGIAVERGRKYLVNVSVDGGKTEAYRYLVEFCAPVASADREAK